MQNTSTHHHVKTLAATSSRPNSETLVVCEVLAHPRAIFYPCTCELRGGTVAVAAALISYGGARSLLGRGCGGDNRLLPLHQRATT
jgi:hypothetical protein